MQRMNAVGHEPLDTLTTAGAAGAISMPWWIHSALNVSPFLAFVAQVLGIIWLLVQIYSKMAGK